MEQLDGTGCSAFSMLPSHLLPPRVVSVSRPTNQSNKEHGKLLCHKRNKHLRSMFGFIKTSRRFTCGYLCCVIGFHFSYCRRKPTEEPAVPSELGLDIFGKAELRGGWRGQVRGGSAETKRLPRRDLLCQWVHTRQFIAAITWLSVF